MRLLSTVELQKMQQKSPADLDDLRSFAAVAATGSFAAAARALSRHPTVLSKRLAGLEHRLGIRLAERTTRSFTLTEAGRLYLNRITPILEELDHANSDAAALGEGEPSGRLRIAVPSTFGRLWLVPIILEFMKTYPKVAVEADFSNRSVDLIGEGYDLAVRLGELSDSRLIARKIGKRRRLVCASPEYVRQRPVIKRPADLTGHPCLFFTGRADPHNWVFHDRTGKVVSVRVSGPLSSDDADLLLGAALEGLGLLYTTDWHVASALADGRLVEVLKGWPVADQGAIYLIMAAARGVPSKTRAFADFLASRLAPLPWAIE